MKKTRFLFIFVPAAILYLVFSAPAFAKNWKLRSADVVEINSPYTIAMNKFAEIVKEKTSGAIQISHFPGGQLGSDPAIVEGVKLGNIDMAMTGYVASKVSELFYLPYLFKDGEHQRKVLNGPIGEKLSKRLEEDTQLKLLGMVYFAPRQLTTSNREAKKPEDLKGLKIRVPNGKVFIATWKALGASPTPIAFTELFTALQQGVVDAQENPYQIIYDSSFYEVQKYVVQTNHCVPVRFLIVNQKLWNDLGESNQQIFKDAFQEVSVTVEKMYLEKDAEYISQLKEKGMIFVEPDIEAFRKATENVWRDFAPEAWGPGVYEDIQKLR